MFHNLQNKSKRKSRPFGYLKKKNNKSEKSHCFICNKQGHWEKDCPKKNKSKNECRVMISSIEMLNYDIVLLEDDDSITLTQTQYCENLSPIVPELVDTTSPRNKIRKSLTPKEQYVAQRARGAYNASLCQLEVSFDLSSAAQIVNLNEADMKDEINYILKKL